MNMRNYTATPSFDELIGADGTPRRGAGALWRYFSELDDLALDARRKALDLAIMSMGITFTVYSDGQNIDRAWPLDMIPRIIRAEEWRRTEAGLKQRLTALNAFIDDIYNGQRIIKDGLFPAELLSHSKNFRHPCIGMTPKHRVWSHICGTDLVRDRDGTQYVLEDNLRVPSGVSYMLENRHVMKRVFPELFRDYDILPIDEYTQQLFNTLAELSPRPGEHPEIAVLTPGIYNSAYFEHCYLAQQMGAELVQGSDLFVGDDDCVYMRTITGPKRVDVIYRRIDDDFLDPECFREDSTLGVRGLMRAWRKGNVGLANAPGAGVADDKVVYAFVPQMIQYYLSEEPLLPNVPTYVCLYDDQRRYVLEHLNELVVKPANESGGYGLLIGPQASAAELARYRDLINADPRNYVAQPTLSLSTVPSLCDGQIEARHVDLRPFVLQADKTYCTTGGLSRVALRKGSLVVNSSQGGGSKDTWVIETGE